MENLIVPKYRQKLNPVTHSIRTAQLVLQYGVGAMVDFPDQTLMTAAPEYWVNNIHRVHDERLEKVLGVDYFGVPGGFDEFKEGVSFTRFPKWYFCPKCRRFQTIESWTTEYYKYANTRQKENDPHMKRPRCMECRKDLVVSRVVVTCEDGHIDDFPWIKWVHLKNWGGEKDICQNPQITFKTGATSAAGLEGLIVECRTCSAKASLNGAFNRNIFADKGIRCNGKHPWKKNATSPCSKFPKAMQRGASSVYFPRVISSLVIPPYSSNVNVKIEQSDEYRKCLVRIEDLDPDERDEYISRKIGEWAERISFEILVDKTQVKANLERRWSSKDRNNDIDTDGVHYKFEEYKALRGDIPDIDGRDFVRESLDPSEYKIPGVARISLIHKVREVRAQIGFSRITPVNTTEMNSFDGTVSIKEPKTNWYPAYEVRGEGIYLEFDDIMIKHWVEHSFVEDRITKLNKNFRGSYQGEFSSRSITPKYVFLHTLAHLLIRQLSFECGYTAASLRERIYCSDSDCLGNMAGILVYTASGDSEGTLGGLVRQGYSDCLPSIFRKSIEAAKICSNDPVCISSSGQGRDSLNLGACHACVLLPETSCEDYNVFLDRALITGTFENPEMGFFTQLF